MSCRQPFNAVATNTMDKGATRIAKDENTSEVTKVEKTRAARAVAKSSATETGHVSATCKIPRPLRSHFCDVVAKVLDKSSSCNTSIIDEKKYDCEYDTYYAMEIITYMRSLEIKKRLPSDYLLNRKGSLNSRNRTIVVDWLIQVQHYLQLKQETLYLTIFIFDHFFVKVPDVAVNKLQLIAVTSVLIASKIEERFIPEFSVLLHLTENSYSGEQLRAMERFILNTLGFQLVMPDPMVFLNRCSQASKCSSKQVTDLSTFLMDTMLPDVKVCRTLLPSQMAASAFCLARKLLFGNQLSWDKTLERHSGYKEKELKETMLWMLSAVSQTGITTCETKGARTKYSSTSKYQNLSKWPILKAEACEAAMDLLI